MDVGGIGVEKERELLDECAGMLDVDFDRVVVEAHGFLAAPAQRVAHGEDAIGQVAVAAGLGVDGLVGDREGRLLDAFGGFVGFGCSTGAGAPAVIGCVGLRLEDRAGARQPDQAQAQTLLLRDRFAGVEDGVVRRAADEGVDGGGLAGIDALVDEAIAGEVGKFGDRLVAIGGRGIEVRHAAFEEDVGAEAGIAAGMDAGGAGHLLAPLLGQSLASFGEVGLLLLVARRKGLGGSTAWERLESWRSKAACCWRVSTPRLATNVVPSGWRRFLK